MLKLVIHFNFKILESISDTIKKCLRKKVKDMKKICQISTAFIKCEQKFPACFFGFFF